MSSPLKFHNLLKRYYKTRHDDTKFTVKAQCWLFSD
jgi:hypothetical protein